MFGGVVNTILLDHAMIAGIPNISTVENKGAVHQGIYNHTFSIALNSCQQYTHSFVCFLSKFFLNCLLWNLLIFS
ncbi:hypothetical protein HOG21_03635 [bacterium]|nr:hypothetical protein [bacterium]